MIDDDRTVRGSDPSWQVADRWSTRRVRLAAGPALSDADIAKALRLELADIEHETGLLAANGAEAVEPPPVALPTRRGAVKVEVLEVRQVELDRPNGDPGD